MPRRCRILLLAALLLLTGTACNVTRYLHEGEYLVDRVKIKTDTEVPHKERITADELDKYIRQSPNKRLLGIDFYVWLYERADTAKHNRWNNWKRRIGEAPVLLDMGLTRKSADNLKIYMDTRGFYASQAEYAIDTLSKPRRARITYRVRQGEPYLIDSVRYEFRDRFLEPIVLADTAGTLLRRNGIFDIPMLDLERERIADNLRRRGYYDFTINNISFVADTLSGDRRVGLTLVVEQHLAGYDARGQAQRENSSVYRIDRIDVLPDYDAARIRSDSTLLARLDTTRYRGLNIIHEGKLRLRPRILRQTIPLYANQLYDAERIDRTYTDLMATGYFKSARIAFTEHLPDPDDSTGYVSYIGAADDSVHHAYTREGYLTCRILGTPARRQSVKADLEGSTTSNFYGLKATVGYQNRNIFRGAEALDLAFTTGYEFMKARDARKRRATEFGITAGLTLPRFLLPGHVRRYQWANQPKTKIEVSVNFQDRPYYRRTLSSAGLTYQWSNSNYSSFALQPVQINQIEVRDLDTSFLMVEDPNGGQMLTPNRYLLASFQTQFIGGLSFGYVYNNQRRSLGGNATNIRFNLETAGNLIDAVEHAFYRRPTDSEAYTIFGMPYSQYFRTDLSISRKWTLGEVTALAGRIYGGVAMAYGNSTSVPFDRQFYCGGSDGMRGWAPRTLGQGSVPNPHSVFPVQTGDVKLEANLEFRFPIWGLIHGATFLDAGNIWYIRSNPDEYADEAVFHFRNFYKQLGFNTGLGLRFDIKFAVLRLDWGIQLHNPNNPAGERWIHNFHWENTALQFGVGYPF